MAIVKIGQRVYSILYGGRDGIIYKIEGEQRPETIKSLGGCGVMGGNAHMYIVFDNGGKSCIPESILHGVQWRIFEEYASDQEIQTALKFADETAEKGRQEAAAEKERQERERERIIREFPFLSKVQDSKRLGSHAVGTKNMKKELIQKFPGVSFSVKSDSYSGGCSIDIHWTDGPTVKEVQEITSKYEEGSFNGMEDIYEYNSANVWPDIFGGAKYVSENRAYTKDAQKVIAGQLKLRISYSQYGSIEFENNSDQHEFNKTISEHSFFVKPQDEKPQTQKAVSETISVEVKNEMPKSDEKPISKAQLWALHCITKLDTRKVMTTYQKADELIKQANRGGDIKPLVRELIAS